MVTIFHAADLHLGMRFLRKTEEVRNRLIQDRFDALTTIVNTANQEGADFLVLAGDLFDTIQVGVQDTIVPTVNILSTFQGEAVLVLPGNHDFYEAKQAGEVALPLWTRFERAAANHPKIQVFTEEAVLSFEIAETKINFFPGICRSRHSRENAIGWIRAVEKDPHALNIGIAHGNVDGYGLDQEGQYFNMTEQELRDSGVDFTLLGHIHVPFPTQKEVLAKPIFFMPGTTAQSAMGRRGKGSYWKIQCDGKNFQRAELRVSSEIEHLDWSNKVVNSEADINQLIANMESLPEGKCLLRLHVSGRLSSVELNDFRNRIQEFKGRFIELDYADTIILNIDEAFINANYTQNSVAYKILSKLNEEDSEGLALQVAYDLIRQK